jgi:hypothetical protein
VAKSDVLLSLFRATLRKDMDGWELENTGSFWALRGSNFELQSQLEIARALGFGDSKLLDEAEGLSFEVGKMISGILNAIKDKK